MDPRIETSQRRTSVFALDVRSLAALRVALGVLLLADLATRAGDLAAMYGPEGAARVDLVRSRLGPGEWSLHLLSPSAAWQATLMIAAATLAALLTIGLWTRAATFGCWLLTMSLHARLPIVLNAGDDLLRVLLFWSLLLPLGAVWSVDARRRGRSLAGVEIFAATFAFTVQLALVYWCAGLTKLNDAWLGGGALDQVLSYGLYLRAAGQWLHQHPAAARWLSWSVLALEILGPFLVFIPWHTARLRVIAIVAFVGFHMGIAATINVGLFAWVGAAAWLAMIPSEVWDRLLHSKAAAPPDDFEAGAAVPRSTPFLRWAAIAAMAVVVAWNALDVLDRTRTPLVDATLRPLVNATGLRQSWSLFSEPAKFDAWFVYRGRLKNGEIVDLLRGVPLRHGDDDPMNGQQFPSHRWRKLHVRVVQQRNAAYRQPLAEAVFRAWNDRHRGDEQAEHLELICLQRRSDPNDPAGGMIRSKLAAVGRQPFAGNFADAVRELED